MSLKLKLLALFFLLSLLLSSAYAVENNDNEDNTDDNEDNEEEELDEVELTYYFEWEPEEDEDYIKISAQIEKEDQSLVKAQTEAIAVVEKVIQTITRHY